MRAEVTRAFGLAGIFARHSFEGLSMLVACESHSKIINVAAMYQHKGIVSGLNENNLAWDCYACGSKVMVWNEQI